MIRGSQWKSEAEFQAKCLKKFEQQYPDQIGRLRLIYNNPPNAIIGGKLITMGLKRGTSDHMYLVGYKRIVFIEYKVGYDSQGKDQEAFEKLVSGDGHEYYVVKEHMEIFDRLIIHLNTKQDGAGKSQ